MSAIVARHAATGSWVVTLLFATFMVPVVFEGLGINYGFVLFPLAFGLRGGLKKLPGSLLFGWVVFWCVLAGAIGVAIAEGSASPEIEGRRLVSFMLFMALFSFSLIEFKKEWVPSFKASVVLLSLVLSIKSLLVFFAEGGSALGFRAKDVVGTQRIGFVYIVALCVLFFEFKEHRFSRTLLYVCSLTTFSGLALTFSRSSVISFAVVVALLVGAYVVRWARRPRFSDLARGIVLAVGLASAVFLTARSFPVVATFFEARIVDTFFDSSTLQERLADPHASEGTRVAVSREIATYVYQRPLVGSGYLGSWSVSSAGIGSAHSQYLDVLLRTGIVGLSAYVVLIVSLLRFLRKTDSALFWGFLGVLVYGLFHETFKEPQGGFVLAFLLGMWADEKRRLGHRRAVARV